MRAGRRGRGPSSGGAGGCYDACGGGPAWQGVGDSGHWGLAGVHAARFGGRPRVSMGESNVFSFG